MGREWSGKRSGIVVWRLGDHQVPPHGWTGKILVMGQYCKARMVALLSRSLARDVSCYTPSLRTSNMPSSLSCVVARRTNLALAPLLVDLRNWRVGGDGLAGVVLVFVGAISDATARLLLMMLILLVGVGREVDRDEDGSPSPCRSAAMICSRFQERASLYVFSVLFFSCPSVLFGIAVINWHRQENDPREPYNVGGDPGSRAKPLD